MRRGPMRWGTNEMGDQWVGGTNEMGDQWNEWCMGANWGINEIGDQWDGGPMKWGTNEMGDQWDGGPMMCTRHSPFRIHDIVTVRWTNRKMSMGYQGSLVWNIIAKHIDMNCSVDTFKKRLKNYTWKTENAIRVGAWVLDTSTRSAQVPDLNFSTRTVLLVLKTTGMISTHTRDQHQSAQYSHRYWLSTSSECHWFSNNWDFDYHSLQIECFHLMNCF